MESLFLPVEQAPDHILNVIQVTNPLLQRLYQTCVETGVHDIVLDVKLYDNHRRVQVSAVRRNKVHTLVSNFDPLNPLLEDLSKAPPGGFWVLIRTDSEQYLYPVSADHGAN